MAHFLPPELVRQVIKLEWPEVKKNQLLFISGSIDFSNYLVPVYMLEILRHSSEILGVLRGDF